jgi:hypothetical protein
MAAKRVMAVKIYYTMEKNTAAVQYLEKLQIYR